MLKSPEVKYSQFVRVCQQLPLPSPSSAPPGVPGRVPPADAERLPEGVCRATGGGQRQEHHHLPHRPARGVRAQVGPGG